MTINKRPRHPIVVMAASAGGIHAVSTVLGSLLPGFPAPIVIVQHRSPGHESKLVAILSHRTSLPVTEAVAGTKLEAGTVYVARADKHLTITRSGCFDYTDGRRIRHVLSSANPLFESAASAFGADAIGVVLTGNDGDGTDGVQSIDANGGVVIAQDRATSAYFGMPKSAIATGAVDYVLPLEEIGPALTLLVQGTPPQTETEKAGSL